MSTPMSHDTVTVVTDGETVTYEMPQVVQFTAATDYDDPVVFTSSSWMLPPSLRSLTFKMLPLKDGPDGRYMTVTRREPSDD